MKKMGAFLIAGLLGILCLAPRLYAQTSAAPPAAAQPGPDQSQLLSSQQLEALVSPIALYPDPLLSEIFMASTYPLEVVEAERWVKANKNLSGEALKAAIDKQGWDDSVKSLAATPTVLDMMSQQLDWTQKLGDAVLAQQADVMAAVQRLRAKAQANNKLQSTTQQTVATQQQDGQSVIVIQPTQPNTIYVPYYDPSVVYGGWPYPSYPPYYWPAPGYIAGGLIATGLAFGAGYALGRWASGGYWGGGFNWGGNNININRNVNINNINRGNNNWVHNPAHRQGVRYNNAQVAQKFGGNRAGGAHNRMDFRGRTGDIGGGNRPNIGAGNNARANAGNRGNIGGGNARANAGNRGNIGGGNARANVGRAGGGSAIGNVGAGRTAGLEGARGRASMGGGISRGGGGGGGGGMARGGGGGFRGGGGGRRSDINLKHDIVLLGRLDNGIGFYRFAYNGSERAYVGVMAQEVQAVMPSAVERGRDGYLRVYYDRLGVKFQTYDAWVAAGARLPVVAH